MLLDIPNNTVDKAQTRDTKIKRDANDLQAETAKKESEIIEKQQQAEFKVHWDKGFDKGKLEGIEEGIALSEAKLSEREQEISRLESELKKSADALEACRVKLESDIGEMNKKSVDVSKAVVAKVLSKLYLDLFANSEKLNQSIETLVQSVVGDKSVEIVVGSALFEHLKAFGKSYHLDESLDGYSIEVKDGYKNILVDYKKYIKDLALVLDGNDE